MPVKALRVWGMTLSVPSWARQHMAKETQQVRAIVAARSRAAAARALDVLPSSLNVWGAETGNKIELETALAEPGRVFVQDVSRLTPFFGAPKPTVIYYTAAWCQPCVAFGPRVEAAAAETGVAVVKVDVDRPLIEYKEEARRIRSVPLLRWVGDRPGAPSLSGAVKRETLVEWFRVGVEDAKR